MLEKIYKDMEKKMTATMEALKKQLNTVRTGRASLSILDGVIVDYHGTPTPLNHLATLAVPDSRLITIQPWDSSAVGEIERAIRKSDLGLNPTSDGKMLKIPIPILTEERRKELTKVVKKMGEECKVAIRNIRREKNDELKAAEKSKGVSEDDVHRAQEKIQKLTDKSISLVEELIEKKSKEVLEV
ncbi:MAG: ribosome recycling factor [Candidatus Tectomicrobia bacterium]|uniref:Ribosome-recycling factor n=1 Tax=Tectimicrobiota bacterium TaxID=2528274 RepID=A0A932CR23_UNCTE|nr:ribosome recycling factor [Candidatus Tectomicrobia bacterium]